MSKHFSQVLFDIENLSTQQLMDKYGIEIDKNGCVYDPMLLSKFDNIDEWANYLLEEEELELTPTFIKRTRKHHFDDED